ncbi:sigma-70 family RNA polymerase sigma factor [Alkalibaculum sp. M08DMB]|uniref:Sigma-70 family RNA polymerase sigma factor n=1 Tax=Alkalibaculum sporogenes TaxID=2655001 RepID=A0A6A7KC41_9FIRM|nr:RNA polymerase sigma factor [Alkalibaculum sporogenes]MPW26747.1 sigma-70 family RNA polymerase sigma factor [Alkalibaculum sporogenes]
MESKLLIKQAKRGDKQALLQLVMTHQNEYYKLAYVFMNNKEDALDTMQDMIIILYENINRLKKEDSFYSWSKTILVNICKKKLRRNKKIISIDDVEEQKIEVYGECEEKIFIQKYLSKLSYRHQEVIRLKYFTDLDYESIAQILKIPVGTVKSRLSNGIKNLKELIGGDYLDG